MNYTSIHINGHLLSVDILHEIETDSTMQGNRELDYNLDVSISAKIDNAWSSLRNDWNLFSERNLIKDTFGTTSVRRLMSRFFSSLDYELDKQDSFLEVGENRYDITYLCPQLSNLPIIVVGDKTGDSIIDTEDKCTLDIRQKGDRKQKSPNATMLDYLNNTDQVYGIVTNGQILRIIRNTGQLVKLTYIEFDIKKIVEEDHYSEFCLLFRILHSSRFYQGGDDACILEQWFNRSIESGNRIRAGLSKAVQTTMEILGKAVLCGEGSGNDALRDDIRNGVANSQTLNKELIHFIYRILFLFIIEDRDLVYDFKESDQDYEKKVHSLEIYKKYYAISRFRHLSEYAYLKDGKYSDLWEGLFESFRLFEDEKFGSPLCISPLGGVLFAASTLKYLSKCKVDNKSFLEAFSCLNEFRDDKQNRVKINYSFLDVEEFGSVYEGILEMRAVITQGSDLTPWDFSFGSGLDRKSTSSYYTRPDLVQSLIRTTLEPVIKEKLAKLGDVSSEEKVKALLSMKLCDAASGSGHIVLAMARTLAWYVFTIRTGEDNPASSDYKQALREVIQKCIYAVDYNPDAVELCKVVLWIEGYCAGKPLSFLDHHIRCGNSVVGVSNLDVLLDGVPQDAFTAENKDVLKQIKIKNKAVLEALDLLKKSRKAGYALTTIDESLKIPFIDEEQIGLAKKVQEINVLTDNSLSEQITKQNKWYSLMASPRIECIRRACDIYTYAFYREAKESDVNWKYSDDSFGKSYQIPYTRTVLDALHEIQYLDTKDSDKQDLTDEFKHEVESAARSNRFFHWCVEFPEVFANGGFDVMCGNPPWDKLQMEDEKWFDGKNAEIVNAEKQSTRKKLIAQLESTDPELYKEYVDACISISNQSNFVKNSTRYSLTNHGKIELSSIFAETCLQFSKDAFGLVIPTGIAINDTSKDYFSKLVDENRLISLYDFENKEGLFDIHRMFKFCLLTAGKPQATHRLINAGFYLTRLDHLLDSNRIYKLSADDFSLLNPNTRTSAICRTVKDMEVTKKIYANSKIFQNEKTGDDPWKIRFSTQFNMATESSSFRTFKQLISKDNDLDGNIFVIDNDVKYVPLYEGKMFWLYNHHFGDWPTDGKRPQSIDSPSNEHLINPDSALMPWYWVQEASVKEKLEEKTKKGELVWNWSHSWLLPYRQITNATNERTFVSTLIPSTVGVGHSSMILYTSKGTFLAIVLNAMMSSIVFDYATRQKVGGSNMSTFFVKQFPVLTPAQIKESLYDSKIVERVAELCYFNHDLDGWMEELWDDKEMTDELRKSILSRLDACNGGSHNKPEPFIYNEDRRAIVQAELDAIFAHLYGLNTEDLRYILDPEDVCGVGCINETFRVLKDREIRELGEYRTKRLVMEAWNKFGFDK